MSNCFNCGRKYTVVGEPKENVHCTICNALLVEVEKKVEPVVEEDEYSDDDFYGVGVDDEDQFDLGKQLERNKNTILTLLESVKNTRHSVTLTVINDVLVVNTNEPDACPDYDHRNGI